MKLRLTNDWLKEINSTHNNEDARQKIKEIRLELLDYLLNKQYELMEKYAPLEDSDNFYNMILPIKEIINKIQLDKVI